MIYFSYFNSGISSDFELYLILTLVLMVVLSYYFSRLLWFETRLNSLNKIAISIIMGIFLVAHVGNMGPVNSLDDHKAVKPISSYHYSLGYPLTIGEIDGWHGNRSFHPYWFGLSANFLIYAGLFFVLLELLQRLNDRRLRNRLENNDIGLESR